MSPMGAIRLRHMRFWGSIGAEEDERARPQEIEVDVEMICDIAPAVRSDRIEDAVNYHSVYRMCERIVTQSGFALLESLAAELVDAIMNDSRVMRVTVRVRKPQLLDGASPEVELTRTRGPAS